MSEMIELPIPNFIALCVLLAVAGYLLGLWLGERTPRQPYYPLSWRARLKTFFWRWTL